MIHNNNKYDVIIIGAGAAGLMAAATAGQRGRKVLLLEASNKIGAKIKISGGGRCNFTNINANSQNYISKNPHFIKSSLSRYNQHDFIKLVERYNIAYHEKTLGQLFCDGPSSQIIDMLINECRIANVDVLLETSIANITKEGLFKLKTNKGIFTSESVIIASGGLSIPKMGASDFGYKIAKQFGLNIIEPKPALVPLTVSKEDLEFYKTLSGISIDSIASYDKTNFRENILFTHRGLSGPAILQISSYIKNLNQDKIQLNLLPHLNLNKLLLENRHSKSQLSSFLKEYLPKRFVDNFCTNNSKRLIDYKTKDLEDIANQLHRFIVNINGSEGYAKAEVTKGGIDTKELSSKTMMANKVPGLYFIGEVVDVTGWLGGYNFQWAWSSGHAVGSYA
ncbi:MAG: NAD(P)/FAD-dependent oxidoreductase [Rickettsiales bacterium]|jgi:predicted Rossmann fold flavoprotein|nr:NAD(P)/FAD-dependent oxidoreductase [Rickettsiales bacterium]